MDAAQLALKDRLCDKSDRIPTSRWPFFSQSLEADIAQNGTQAFLTFTAERDTLLTDLCIAIENPGEGEGPIPLPGKVTIEYCNVQYGDHTDSEEWKCCCDRKPIFLVGVREDKKLRFQIDMNAPVIAGGAHITLTVSGFQGDGCCS